MNTDSARRLLEAAITEVAASPLSMRKLARAACTRANLEREWVYEIDGTTALEDYDVKREVHLGGRLHADLQIEGTPVEFKSTKPWYANDAAFAVRDKARRNSAEYWLSGDMTRMSERDGIFVLLISTADDHRHLFWAGHSLDDLRTHGVTAYAQWLKDRAEKLRTGASVDWVEGGRGEYADKAAQHDALIVWWPESETRASRVEWAKTRP